MDYLQYTGKWRIVVDVIKRGKKPGSRKLVPTSLHSMVKRPFEDDDILDARAIDHYEQLKDLNVHLHLDNDIKESIEEPVEEVPEEQVEEVKETPIEVTESETVEEQPAEEVPEEQVEENVETFDDNDKEFPQPIEESDRAEMIAYLDASYDKDGLKNLAKEFGIEFNSRISTEKLIEKLIDEKYPQILELMK